jgi:hypothetical protein
LQSNQDFNAVFRTKLPGQNHQLPVFTPHGRESLRKTICVSHDSRQLLFPSKPCPQFAFHQEHLPIKLSYKPTQLNASAIACSVVIATPFDHANS